MRTPAESKRAGTRIGAGLSALGLLVLALIGYGGTPTATAKQPTKLQVSVFPCPIPPSDYFGTPATPQHAPLTLSVAAALAPPKGGQLYGAKFPDSTPSYLLGTTSMTCTGRWGSADGAQIMIATPTAGHARGVTMWIHAGGVGPSTDLACPYIPAVLSADRAFRGNASLCGRPSGDVVHQIPTGTPALYAAVVWVPSEVKDPNLTGSGDGTDPTVALYTARVIPVVAGNTTPSAEGQMISCTLPVAEAQICRASLEFFLAKESEVGAHVHAAELSNIKGALSGFLAEH